ncbi:class I tRNA ligase family protein [Cellulomonas sp. McL0617]|uniref:class I tRNA ligase family protein n=1 Tax=Cellulomonas sp. McL0617 TaxID=3415675 RepID=UPI003CEB91BD
MHEIESRWQATWERLFEAEDDGSRPRRYLLTMFPYPSGDLHMGHAEVFALADVVARYWRLKGFDVLFPIGWDSFGLPAENAARKRGEHPATFTYDNIETQARSLRRYGVSFDWSRRLHTSDPEYLRWTQWLFLTMHERGLAYRAPGVVNWCAQDATVLANEQVVDGRCERCGSAVEARELTQWYLRITDYADRLVDDMASLEGVWPEHVLTMQRNWIGRSTGDDGSTTYRLHDWLVSRQRSWGTPIPIVHCPGCGEVPVPLDQLPVLLPWGEPVAPVPCPRCGGPARRETDTLDTFVDSSWYFLRYCSPGREDVPFDVEDVRRWMPATRYVGGVEHAILHLLYSRFVTKVLHDAGLVDAVEPFASLLNQGQVLNGGKAMSKSLGNGVALGEQLDRYGVDAVRLTMVFAGPPEDDIDWADLSPARMRRFLARALRLARDVRPGPADEALRRTTHRTVHDCEELLEASRFNVVVARVMKLVSAARRAIDRGSDAREAVEVVAVLLSLVAPYTAEEMWEALGHEPSVASARWPVVDTAMLVDETVEAVVQVDGKVRDRLEVPTTVTADELVAWAVARPAVARAIGSRTVSRTVARPPRLVNVVTDPGGGEER